jgi:hypothetical protein
LSAPTNAAPLNYSDTLYIAKQQLENDLTLLDSCTAITPQYRAKLVRVIAHVNAAWLKHGGAAQP